MTRPLRPRPRCLDDVPDLARFAARVAAGSTPAPGPQSADRRRRRAGLRRARAGAARRHGRHRRLLRARSSCSGRFARPRASRCSRGAERRLSIIIDRPAAATRVVVTCRWTWSPTAERPYDEVRAWFAARPGAALGGVRRRRVPRAGARAGRALRARRRHPDRVRRAGGQGRQLVGGDRGGDDGGGARRVAAVDRAAGCARSAASRSRT